tara:strand:+ start:351 stop:620 length:270 start_codon:yes stop_codon:yes gene_type:complete
MDFFGNIFTQKLLGQGLEMAFGGGGGDRPQIQYNLPSYGKYEMTLNTPSEAGEVDKIESESYETLLALWTRRLYGDDSYTNITIPNLRG